MHRIDGAVGFLNVISSAKDEFVGVYLCTRRASPLIDIGVYVRKRIEPRRVYSSWLTFITSFAIKCPILIIKLEPRKTCTGERKSVSMIKTTFLIQDEIAGYREVHL